jgi:hypothetical protein
MGRIRHSTNLDSGLIRGRLPLAAEDPDALLDAAVRSGSGPEGAKKEGTATNVTRNALLRATYLQRQTV